MENASKALIIAGGVLIGLITISLFYFMFNRISVFVDENSEDYKTKELQAFNQGFEAYNKKIMYGADVVSVLNKAIDNNIRLKVTAGDDSGYSVNVVIKFKSNLEGIFSSRSAGYSLQNNQNYLNEKIIEPLLNGHSTTVTSEFKRRTFYCSSIRYSDKTGRVSQMTFIEK